MDNAFPPPNDQNNPPPHDQQKPHPAPARPLVDQPELARRLISANMLHIATNSSNPASALTWLRKHAPEYFPPPKEPLDTPPPTDEEFQAVMRDRLKQIAAYGSQTTALAALDWLERFAPELIPADTRKP